MQRLFYIGLIFDYGTGYCRSVLRGIKRYAEAIPHWVLVPVVPEPRAIRTFAKLNPDGLITYVYKKCVSESLAGIPKPRVNVCGIKPDPGIPLVGPDDIQVGQLAAAHL